MTSTSALLLPPRAGPPAASDHRRRKPERSVLHRVVARHLLTFLEHTDRDGGPGLPGFVRRELTALLDCGVLAKGFARVRCTRCGDDLLVAFSCKGRGICPSCGRRMADTAAHLVDRVLPRVPVRQWVLSLLFSLRFGVAFDRELCRRVRGVFLGAVLNALRRRARERHGIAAGRSGAVVFVQRFGGALNLNVHFHALVLDGVFHEATGAEEASPAFRATGRPGPGDLADILQTVHVTRVGGQRGVPFVQLPRDDCAVFDGFSLHAGPPVPGTDRERLERLCRYVARPALATSRLHELPDGRLAYELRNPWSDGTRQVVFEPLTFLEKLAALVPPPRAHLVTYHGVLAPAAARRSRIVPRPPPRRGRCSPVTSRRRPYPWAELMQRVFAIDVLHCTRCGGRRRLIALITQGSVITAILRSLGLPHEPPTLHPARGPPELFGD